MGKARARLTGAAFNALHPRGADGRFVKKGSAAAKLTASPALTPKPVTPRRARAALKATGNPPSTQPADWRQRAAEGHMLWSGPEQSAARAKPVKLVSPGRARDRLSATAPSSPTTERGRRLTRPDVTRAEVEAEMDAMTVPQLKQLGAEIGGTVSVKGNKAQIRASILEGTVGFRERSAAIGRPPSAEPSGRARSALRGTDSTGVRRLSPSPPSAQASNIKMPKGLTDTAEDTWLDLARGIADATSTTQIEAILGELSGLTPSDGLPSEEIERLAGFARMKLNDLRISR